MSKQKTADEKLQSKADGLSEEFHEAAGNLHNALTYAYSMDCEGEICEAFGAAVTHARKLVAIDAKLREVGRDYYEYEIGEVDPDLQNRIDASLAVKALSVVNQVLDAVITEGNLNFPGEERDRAPRGSKNEAIAPDHGLAIR